MVDVFADVLAYQWRQLRLLVFAPMSVHHAKSHNLNQLDSTALAVHKQWGVMHACTTGLITIRHRLTPYRPCPASLSRLVGVMCLGPCSCLARSQKHTGHLPCAQFGSVRHELRRKPVPLFPADTQYAFRGFCAGPSLQSRDASEGRAFLSRSVVQSRPGRQDAVAH
jgi:hypothetical protein